MEIEDEWGRLDAVPELGNRAGIYTMGGELRRNGHTSATLGLVDLGEAYRRGDSQFQLEIPVLNDVALSLAVEGEISLIGAKANAFRRNHPVLATGLFQDPHPDKWMKALAAHDHAVLVTAGGPPRDFPTLGHWMEQWHIGLVPVAYRLDADGFSIYPQGSTRTEIFRGNNG